jgi:nucleotide-binding universal stress UspA family protein
MTAAPAAFLRPMLATEHSEFDVGAERVALALAARRDEPLATVLPMVGNPEFDTVAPDMAARADALVADKLQRLQALAAAQGVRLAVQVRRGTEPYREIVDAAVAAQADLIIIRRRGHTGLLANLLLGEMVSKVVAHAPCNVLVNARGAQLWCRRVLLAVDPAAVHRGAVALAARVAVAFELPLAVVCVAEAGGGVAEARQALAAAVAQAHALGAAAEGEVLTGKPHALILEAAHRDAADLIVLARHGATRLARAWVGSVAQKVIGLAECPVLVCVSPTTAAVEGAT